jgi:predicted nucleic acid-binding Zn ribbon protein
MLRQRLIPPGSEVAGKLFALKGQLRKRSYRQIEDCPACGLPISEAFWHRGDHYCSEKCARLAEKMRRMILKGA